MTRRRFLSIVSAFLLVVLSPAWLEAAYLHSPAVANGTGPVTLNLSAATWQTIDATSLLDDETLNVALTTSYVNSSTWTTGGSTTIIDGVAIRIATRPGTPGVITVTVALDQGGSDVAGTPTTINLADIAPVTIGTLTTNAGVGGAGWYFFKFSGNVTLAATTAYSVKIKQSSVAGGTALTVCAASGTNWSRLLRTTTTASVATGDVAVCGAEFYGLGTNNVTNLNMDSVNNTIAPGGVVIGYLCKMTVPTTASYTAALQLNGYSIGSSLGGKKRALENYGTIECGTVGTPIPATSTATFTFNTASVTGTQNFGFYTHPGASTTLAHATAKANTVVTAPVGALCNTTNVANSVVTLTEGRTTSGMVATDAVTVNGVARVISSVTNATTLVLTTNAGALTNVSFVHNTLDLTISVSNTTGWANGDTIALGSTTQTRGDCEKVVVSSFTASSFVSTTIPASYHGFNLGPATNQSAEVCNLTRGVVIKSNNLTTAACCFSNNGATTSLTNVEMQSGMPGPGSAGVQIRSGVSFTATGCAFHDNITSFGANPTITFLGGLCTTVSITGSVVAWSVEACLEFNNSVNSGTTTVDSNVFMVSTGTAFGLVTFFLDGNSAVTFTNNKMVGGATSGMWFQNTISTTVGIASYSGNNIHACGTATGAAFDYSQNNQGGATFGSMTIWRNLGMGAQLSMAGGPIACTAWNVWGNSVAGVCCGAVVNVLSGSSLLPLTGEVYFDTFTVDAGTNLTQPVGMVLGNYTTTATLQLTNSTFGTTNTHATADLKVQSAANPATNGSPYIRMICQNCKFNSATPLLNQTVMASGSYIASSKHQQTAGSHQTWTPTGILTNDATYFNIATPGVRLTPNNATIACDTRGVWGGWRVPVKNGQTATATIQARVDSTYNGATKPQLMVRRNAAIGVGSYNADTVLATATSATNSFQALTGTTVAAGDDGALEFYGTAYGTVGWVTLDDFSVVISGVVPKTGGMFHWVDGAPFAVEVGPIGAFFRNASMPREPHWQRRKIGTPTAKRNALDQIPLTMLAP